MEIRCCICSDKDNERLYRKIGDYSLWRCARCKLVYFKEPPAHQVGFISDARQDLDTRQREKVEYWSFPHLYEKHKPVFHRYFSERLSRIRAFQPEVRAMFDIGCGYGFWLKYCQDNGIAGEGLDISEEAVKYAQETLRLTVKLATLETFAFKRDYDAMVICDLLEHLPEPNSQLLKIRAALSSSGVLFIQVPNLLGLKLPPFHGFGLPYHIWQFSIPTLKKLLQKNGFTVLRCWTGVMGVVGVYESGGPGIMDTFTWEVARRLKLGNRLMVLAKKA